VKDVVSTLLDAGHWLLTDQLICVTKPLVDVIGDTESRDAMLVDCMLQLIWAHQEISQLPYVEGNSVEFSNEARLTLNHEFHAMNTDLHWLALFLHPLGQKLAICSAVHSQRLTDAIAISLKITKQWKWSKGQAIKLVADLKKYFASHAPFSGGKSNAREWWSCLIADSFDHPLKTLAIHIHKIVPHAADVE
jgi:hypothetical protein